MDTVTKSQRSDDGVVSKYVPYRSKNTKPEMLVRRNCLKQALDTEHM